MQSLPPKPTRYRALSVTGAVRQAHSRQDESIYVLSGRRTLHTDAGDAGTRHVRRL